jgi:hypothetical protein
MFKRLVVGCMALRMFEANAASVVYTSTQYDTAAAAAN